MNFKLPFYALWLKWCYNLIFYPVHLVFNTFFFFWTARTKKKIKNINNSGINLGSGSNILCEYIFLKKIPIAESTSEVVDVVLKNTSCRQWSNGRKTRSEEISEIDYQHWFISHDYMCQHNHDGSAQVLVGSSSKHIWQS